MSGPSGPPVPHFRVPPKDEAGATALVVERIVPPAYDWSRTVLATLVAVAIVVIGIGIVWHRQLGLLLFGGIVLATAMNPFIDWLTNRLKLAKVHAAILVYSILIVLLVGALALIVPETIAQAQAFWSKLPGWYDQSRDFLQASSNRTLRSVGARVPGQMPQFWNLGWLNSGLGSVNSSPLDVLGQVGAGILGVLAVGALGFYWSVNEELTVGGVLELAPDHRRQFYQSLIDELLKKLGGYIRGQLILCAVVGVISLIAYLVIGLPYALLLAIIAGVLEAVPIIGPTLGAVPAILVALSLGPQETALVIGAAMLIQTLENYLLVPKIMDRSVGIGAVVTLLAIVVCGALFGLVGAIFAIPLAAVAQTLFERLVLQADFKEKEFTATRDSAGVLHYQLLELINDVKRKQRQKDSPIDPWTTETFAEIETLAVALDELIITTEDVESPAPATIPLATVPTR